VADAWVPVIAYTKQSTVDALLPLIRRIEGTIHKDAPEAVEVMRSMLGATPEMIAWGKLLDACALAEMEVVDDA
jgi:hypothetical protein